ncbi:MAG: hypothetical protein KA292_13440 [Sphingorhabdus sp.]|nr:hypothetical protein [Sphingorhabdus sp.]
MCSNSLCKKFTVSCMHETARRLLASGLAKGAKDFTEIARGLGGSDQSATNWKKRGVPKQVLIAAATKIGVDIAWLSADPHAPEPPFVTRWRDGKEATTVESATPYRPMAEESRTPYITDPEEKIVLDAFRIGDDGLRRTMLLLARDFLARGGKRAANHG